MAEPPVVMVSYDPTADPSITVNMDPLHVPRGIFELVWLKAGSFTDWRFADIVFEPPRAFSRKSVRSRVVTVMDRNMTPLDHGTIKYSILIIDETSGQPVLLDPQIVNDSGGGGTMEDEPGPPAAGREGSY